MAGGSSAGSASARARRSRRVLSTLRGRLVLLVCIATVPAILFTFYVASNERGAVLQRTERDARHLAALASREHSQQLEGAKRLLRRLGARLSSRSGNVSSGGCPELLPAVLAGFPQFANIGILDRDGHLLCSVEPAGGVTLMQDNPAFVRALRSSAVEIGSYVIGPIVHRPVLHLAYAMRDLRNTVDRVIFVALDLRWLTQLAEQADLPADYALIIADRDGRVLAQSGATDDARGGQRALLPWLAGLAAGRGGTHAYVDRARGRFFVAAPLRGIPALSVVAGLPYDRVTDEANAAFYRTVLGLALLTLFTIAAALFAAEVSVLRVVRALSHAARLFGSGDLSARAVVPRSHGELTELTGAFNSMADALEVRQREAIDAQARLRALSNRLQAAREAEAGRIARELHDELGQVLTSVKLDLASLRRRALRQGPSTENEPFDAAIVEMSQRIDEAVNSVRRISGDLRPAVLDRLGLAAALEWLAREHEVRTGLRVSLAVDGLEEPIEPLVSITVFRIVQEALTNVARHADATRVAVRVDARGGDLVLEIDDDGRGIDPERIDEATSLGLLGMKERALLVNGTFDVSRKEPRGTTIVLRIPNAERPEPDVARPAG
ncbi:MAG: HAMP domain-containing protein [Deltaproteobacteria bacterium]|nr:HAMP domain-containing protein [Deltaproteobacteria bacterium]